MGKVILRPHVNLDFTRYRRAKYTITALYQDRETQDWSYIEDSATKTVRTIRNDEYEKIKNKIKALTIVLDAQTPSAVVCEINESFGEQINKSAKAIKNFWLNHYQVTDESGKHENKNIDQSNYIMLFDEDDYAQEQMQDDKMIVDARAAFLSLKFKEKKSLAILFGFNPANIEEKLLDYKMVSLRSGLATATDQTASLLLSLIKKISDEVVVNSRNAILAGVVVKDDNTYYFDSSSLGRKPEDVEAYFINNPSQYSLLVKDLKDRNIFIEIEEKKEVKTKEKAVA